jgi:hypothetical protein
VFWPFPLGALVVLLLVFLAGRAIVLWYWRINRIIENQEAILAELRRIGARIAPGDAALTDAPESGAINPRR